MRMTKHLAKILIPVLREVAESFGYCLAVHGSLRRDIDLVAVPWRENPCSVESLMEAIGKVAQSVRGASKDFLTCNSIGMLSNPEKKPCGRLAYTIQLGGGPYLDISVMPPPAGTVPPVAKETVEGQVSVEANR